MAKLQNPSLACACIVIMFALLSCTNRSINEVPDINLTPGVMPVMRASGDNIVHMKDISMPDNGWILLMNQEGLRLGLAPLSSGNHSDVRIEVDQDLLSSVVEVRLYLDKGEVGVFEPDKDLMIRDFRRNYELKGHVDELENKILISGLQFIPETIRVKTGESVVWVNRDNVDHTLRGLGGEVRLNPGEGVEYVFNQAGRYPYVCGIHDEMTGEVLVGDFSSENTPRIVNTK